MAHITRNMRQKAKNLRLPSNKQTATVNRAGGTAFELSDPALKLICMTGGSFYAEPKFYSGDSVTPKRAGANGRAPVSKKFQKLAKRLDIVDGKLAGFVSCDELDDVAREVIATAIDVANSDTPEDLLAIARWLRNDAYIRLTPQVLLVIASQIDATKPFVRKYAPHVIVRPDEVKTVLLLHRFFFGMKNLSNGLDYGIGEALSKFNERALLKYDGADYPTWKDVLSTIHRGKKGKSSRKGLEWPLPRALTNYFLRGDVDVEKIPVVAARKELNKLKKFDERAKELAVKSFVNWEVLLSQFGKNYAAEAWSFLLEKGLVGHMALLRNLRKLLEHGVSDDVINLAYSRMIDPKQVARSKQFPFRFLMAHRVLSRECGGWGWSGSQTQLNRLLEAVETAANLSVENVPRMPGLTVIFADNSGSMSNNPVSGRSKMDCAGAANALCGVVAKCSERAVVCAFGTDIAPVSFTKHDTVVSIAEKVQTANTRGSNTNAYLIPGWLNSQGLKPDRVIILSDLQAWSDSSMAGSGWDRNDKALCDTWHEYVARGGKDTWLHCVHLNGHGDTPVDDGALVNQVSGFSEKVVGMLLQTESGDGDSLPTVEQVRKNWCLG